MLISRRFVTAESDEFNVFGFQPEGIVDATPGRGDLVAHDVMEHIGDGPDGYSDEMMALGALFWLRVETGWQSITEKRYGYRNIEIGGDISYVLRKHYLSDGGNPEFLEPGPEEPLDWEDETYGFEAIARKSIAEALDEIDSGESEERKAETKADFQELEVERKTIAWLRRGYRLAEERYSKLGSYEAQMVFNRIAVEVDILLKEADTRPGIPLEISVDPVAGSFRMESPICNTIEFSV